MSDAFSPEIVNTFKFIENSNVTAELVAKHLNLEEKFEAGKENKAVFTKEKFQINLLYIQKQFEEAFFP